MKNKENLKDSALHRVMPAEIMAVETELGQGLPSEYENFLTDVGVGKEYGGLAIWFHLDLARFGNLLELNEKFHKEAKLPKSFLSFYDSYDDEIYGFIFKTGGALDDAVYSFNRENNQLEKISDSFNDFLDTLLELSSEEFQEAQKIAR